MYGWKGTLGLIPIPKKCKTCFVGIVGYSTDIIKVGT